MPRLKPKERHKLILNAAIQLAREKGFENLTRDSIAQAADVSHGLVTYYYNTMKQVRRAVMRAAVKQEILEIIAYGLATANPHALKAPSELRERAIRHMGGTAV